MMGSAARARLGSWSDSGFTGLGASAARRTRMSGPLMWLSGFLGVMECWMSWRCVQSGMVLHYTHTHTHTP